MAMKYPGWLAGRAPVEDFELHGGAAVEFVDPGGEGEIELADGQRPIAGIPPDGFVGHRCRR